MAIISEAPISDPVIDDAKKARPAWVEFFANLTRGDVGTTWTPIITGLTTVGTPTISGVYYQNNGFTDWAVKIVPATNTSSTLGITFITLPFNVTADVPCFAVYGFDSGRWHCECSSETSISTNVGAGYNTHYDIWQGQELNRKISTFRLNL